MLRVHYCPNCKRISYSSYLSFKCRACDIECARFDIPFVDYVKLDTKERESYIIRHSSAVRYK